MNKLKQFFRSGPRRQACVDRRLPIRIAVPPVTPAFRKRLHSGCATYKWKLSRRAFLPVVFKLAIQMAAAESQDRVGSSNGPEHSRPFETESHHRLATSFNDARTNK